MAEFNWPVLTASTSSGPIQIEKDGADVTVGEDTATPGNSQPLPVKILDSAGEVLGETGNAVIVDGSAVTQPVSAAALPLPTGAATSAKQDTANTTLSAIDGHVDGIEALLGTTNSTLTTIDGRVDGVETLLTAIDGHVDGIEALIGTTNSTLTTIDGHVDGIEGSLTSLLAKDFSTETTLAAASAKLPATLGQKAMSAALAVSIASDQSAVAVKPNTGTLTDRSGSTSGTPSTSTQVAASNSTRKYFFIQNTHATSNIWLNFTTAAAATQPSIKLTPGSSFVMEASFVSTEAINVLSTEASISFAAKEA